MPAWLGPAIAATAGLFGQERTNRQNAERDDTNRRHQTSERMAAESFSERMRNTEWQAGIADMEAAGVNPALAYSRGPASAPTSSGSSGGTTPANNSVTSALQLMQGVQQLRLIESQVGKTMAERDSTIQDEWLKRATNTFLMGYEGGDRENLLRRRLRAGIAGAEASNELTRSRTDILGPKREIMDQLDDALRPLFQSLGNGLSRATNLLTRGR